ncbi:type II toxin-antitoxin system Phd/YefM family antitoxin [Patescibacteria group bacterium]
MKKAKHSEKYTSQNELKIRTKAIIDEVEQGSRYIVMRYSKPMAVLLSMEDYCELIGEDPKDCDRCQEAVAKAIDKLAKTKK